MVLFLNKLGILKTKSLRKFIVQLNSKAIRVDIFFFPSFGIWVISEEQYLYFLI